VQANTCHLRFAPPLRFGKSLIGHTQYGQPTVFLLNNQIWGVEKASKSIAGAIGRSCGMLMAIGLTISSMTLAAWLWRSSSVPGLIAILIPTAITFIIDVILVAYYDAV
jgi:hypothetical protein